MTALSDAGKRDPFGLFGKWKHAVPHEVTLLAFARNADGSMSIYDIVETSNHFASKFWSRYRRNAEICAVEVCTPGTARGRRIELRGASS